MIYTKKAVERSTFFWKFLEILRFLRVFWEKWGGSLRFFDGEISLR
jgi:hypothetical protein